MKTMTKHTTNTAAARRRAVLETRNALQPGELDDEEDEPPAGIAALCIGCDLVIAGLKLERLVPAHRATALELLGIGGRLITAHVQHTRSHRASRVARAVTRKRGARG